MCKACTCHINGKAFNPCSVPVSDIKPTDEITTIEGLPATVGADLHPMQQAWLDYGVAQCGYCQPGQLMAAVAKVKQVRAAGRQISDADLDEIRNICRCGTYHRIREAIFAGAQNMRPEGEPGTRHARTRHTRTSPGARPLGPRPASGGPEHPFFSPGRISRSSRSALQP